jgi:hypothetical protein
MSRKNLFVFTLALLGGCAEMMPSQPGATHVPLSGRTMQFDGGGRCVSGC